MTKQKVAEKKVTKQKVLNHSFGSDNHSGVHPQILQALIRANEGHAPSYGTDETTVEAQELFRQHFGPCETFFVFNGTAANVLCIKSLLKSFESVICSEEAHINVDECGAPEAIAGCKLIPVPSQNGKITPQSIKPFLIRQGDQHMSQVKMISITQPTELGTVYSLEEMKNISDLCKEYNLFFHVDGARFIHATQYLKASFKELSTDLGVDALSFGGTKNGLLFGEAVILFNEQAAKNFKYIRKQNMQLPSKMRFLSAQFIELLSNDLWKEISFQEHQRALELFEVVKDVERIEITQPVQSNAVFPKVPQSWIKPLKKEGFFYVWDERQWILRWMMSFNTTSEDVQSFANRVKELSRGQ